LALYSSNLAVPPQRNSGDVDVLAGKTLFVQTQCSECHAPQFEEQQDTPSAFTDLLLHDMGDGLRDNTYGDSELAREWRTPPLWGLGYTKEVNGNENYLHDGRARTLQEAILWHGGEAQQSNDQFRSLSKMERNQLLTYLSSL